MDSNTSCPLVMYRIFTAYLSRFIADSAAIIRAPEQERRESING